MHKNTAQQISAQLDLQFLRNLVSCKTIQPILSYDEQNYLQDIIWQDNIFVFML